MKWYRVLQQWSFTRDAKDGYWKDYGAVKANGLTQAAKIASETLIKNNLRRDYSETRTGQNLVVEGMHECRFRILLKK